MAKENHCICKVFQALRSSLAIAVVSKFWIVSCPVSIDFIERTNSFPFGFRQGILSGVVLLRRTKSGEADLVGCIQSLGHICKEVVNLKLATIKVSVT